MKDNEVRKDNKWHEADFIAGWQTLRELCRSNHPKEGMQVASRCICGYGMGKNNNPACRMLETLRDFVKYTDLTNQDDRYKEFVEQLKRSMR